MEELTQDLLKSLVRYAPETGIFTRIKRTSNRIKVGDIASTNSGSGYIQFYLCNKKVFSHRMAFMYMTGSIPKYIDHINTDGRDNRWCNLRACTQAENAMNVKIRSDSTSGVKGVSWVSEKKVWKACITHNKKKKHIGYFKTVEKAETAIREARSKYHGEFANHG